jgi:hypothetical protein
MALGTYNTIIGVVLAILAAVVIDRLYQRLSHKWTNEPPLLPYRVPIMGHALMFSSNPVALFELAQCMNSVPLILLSGYDQGIILVHTPGTKVHVPEVIILITFRSQIPFLETFMGRKMLISL